MNLADALSGRAGLEGIRWMLTRAPFRALRRELGALLIDPAMLGPCHLRRVRFKPGHKLLADYDATIRVEGNGKYSLRPVFVVWGSYKDRVPCQATVDRAEMEAEALRRGVTAPFQKLAADRPELRVHVRVSPLDVHFPQLVRVSDPEYVRGMVDGAYGAGDRAPDHAGIGRYSVTSVRYRPALRHVLRYDPLDAPERGALFAKLYTTGEDGERIFRFTKQIEEWLAERGDGFASLQPLAYVADDAVILYPQVKGTSLSELLRRPAQSLASSLKSAGAALYALHQLPRELAGPLKLPDFSTRVQQIARTSEYVCALLPFVGATLKALLDRAGELYERLPIEPPAFVHGDFKAEHVWVVSDGLMLIDFDGCSLSDPALDIGRFLSDLRFWCAVYGQYELRHAQDEFLAGYGFRTSEERMARARLYEVIELVRTTVRRVRMYESDWARRTERLIHSAQAVLDDLQSTLGLPAKRSLSAGYPVMSSGRRPMRGGWRRQPSPNGGSG
jgi:hypothetical protein